MIDNVISDMNNCDCSNTFHCGYQVKKGYQNKKQIKERLYRNPIINSPNIKTEVKDGRAVLTGFAATQLEKSTVTIEVYQGGAEVVDNEFGVTSEPEIVNE